jgi:hypothetical protein
MNKLKQNAFWFGVAGALAVVGAVAALWWYPLYDTASATKTKIASLKSELESTSKTPLFGGKVPGATSGAPSDPDIKKWSAVRAQYIEDYKLIAKHYADRDKALETWFADLPNKTNPSYDQFGTPYKTAAGELEQGIRGKGIKVGYPKDDKDPNTEGKYGFNWADIANLPWQTISEDERRSAVRDFQKRYWICELIRDAITADGVKVDRLNDVYFFKPVADPSKFPADLRPAVTDGEIRYVNNPLEAQGLGGQNKFDEFVLPEGDKPAKPEEAKNYLGKTITFGFSVTLSYSDVAKLIREVITPSKSQLLVNVIGVRVFVPKQNPFTREATIRPVKGDPTTETQKADKKRELEADVKPVPVTVWITGQVIDFDASKLPAWAK